MRTAPRERAASFSSSSHAKTYVGSAVRRCEGAAVVVLVGVSFGVRMSSFDGRAALRSSDAVRPADAGASVF